MLRWNRHSRNQTSARRGYTASRHVNAGSDQAFPQLLRWLRDCQVVAEVARLPILNIYLLNNRLPPRPADKLIWGIHLGREFLRNTV